MKWKKEVQRENDFLKNYLFYESFVDNFLKKWNFLVEKEKIDLVLSNGDYFLSG